MGLSRAVPAVRQRDVSDCGAACLVSIAAWYRLHLPIARVRQLAQTDRRGTTALGLVEAADRLGFQAKGVRATPVVLDTLPLPAIAHVVRGQLQHWVVLARVSSKRVEVMDPASGARQRVSRESFEREWSGVMVLLTPASRFVAGDQRTPIVRRFLVLVAPHRAILAMALVGAAVHTALGLTTTVYVQQLVDHVLVDGNRNLLNLMSIAMVILVVAHTLVGGMKGLLILHTGQRIDATLILGYYRHLLSLPQRFFDTMRIGEITSRIGDAVKIRALINDIAIELVMSALIIALSLGLLFLYSATLGVVVVASVPVYATIWAVTNARNRRVSRELMERSADLQSQLVESVSVVGTIKRFGLEAQMELRTEARFVRLLRAVFQSARTSLMTSTTTAAVSRLAVIAVLWIGSLLVIDRRLTPGQLMSSYALLGYLTGPLLTLIAANRTIQDALIAADRLFEIMDLQRDRVIAQATIDAASGGDIEFDHVSFRYGARAPALQDVTLRFRRGTITAIVGESGSGKSTIAALVQRVYMPDEGRIRLGGVDVRHLSRESMRALSCTVPQRIDLIAGSVLENIALGDADPDVKRVLHAAREAGIVEMIDGLPAGLDTELGENGATLSGGERQRLAIARALYRDPEILILDEATSSLDGPSVLRVRQMVEERRARGRTVIVIAHNLDLVIDADHIVVMRRGMVMEEGSHGDLVSRRGAYHALWESRGLGRVA
ncbi:MAG TPA: peptidase domain-containing ABC transporter [Gemmatimonadaceae bacterium]|nr:peptidase domain-containing ABC transporter [Gemmatimonadaceae bacterium]